MTHPVSQAKKPPEKLRTKYMPGSDRFQAGSQFPL
jgi:hypothetical protein